MRVHFSSCLKCHDIIDYIRYTDEYIKKYTWYMIFALWKISKISTFTALLLDATSSDDDRIALVECAFAYFHVIF